MAEHTIPEIVEGLYCLTVKQHHCEGCPYNPKPGREWAYWCIRGQGEIIAEAQEALRETEEYMREQTGKVQAGGIQRPDDAVR